MGLADLARLKASRIGILGGTFDPIHYGHLTLARRFTELLQLTELVLLPAGQPWQKEKARVSNAQHRLAMTRIAAQTLVFPETTVVVATDEIEAAGPTYTVNTLAKWRQRIGWDASLSLLMGADQLLQLETWHHWRCLFNYAHLCIAARVGFAFSSASSTLANEIAQRQANVEAIRNTSYGQILLENAPMPDISATQIRRSVQSVQTLMTSRPPSEALPTTIWRYICKHHLYQN